MDAWLDREHHLHERAEQVAVLLEGLWGDLPPISPNPQLTALIDAVCGDDAHGRAAQLIVHGDGLTYQQLAAALLDTGPRSVALAKLPPRLLRRLVAAGFVDATTSPGMAALPDERCGAWELEAGTNMVGFDATCARLLGIGHAAGRRPFPLRPTAQTSGPARAEELKGPTMHPDDRATVVTAVQEALRCGRGYEIRFRMLMADERWAWRASRGRVLPASETTSARLVGFVAADE